MGDLTELPVYKKNKSVFEALIQSSRLNMEQCLIIGWKDGNLIVRTAKGMIRSDSLWLLKAAEMDVLGMTPTMTNEIKEDGK